MSNDTTYLHDSVRLGEAEEWRVDYILYQKYRLTIMYLVS